MLPIIRRTRRPLSAPEMATVVPLPEKRSDFGQVRSDSITPSLGDKHAPLPPSITGSQSPTTKQIYPTATPLLEVGCGIAHDNPSPDTRSRPGSLDPSTFSHQLSTNPPASALSTINQQLSTNLWSLQPGEPATDYQVFAAWLQLPPPRAFRNAAAALKCSVQSLRRLAARCNWRSRAEAFDDHRAAATSKALDQLLYDEIVDLKQRAERFRDQEWLLHEEMLEVARAVARELKTHPRRISITELTRLLDLASNLGRRATGLPLDRVNETPPLRPNWDAEAALRKIYGDSGSTSEAGLSGPQPRDS